MDKKRIYILCSDGVLYTGIKLDTSNAAVERTVRLAVLFGFKKIKMRNAKIKVVEENQTTPLSGLIVCDAERDDVQFFITDIILDNVDETQSITIGVPRTKTFGKPIDE